VKLAWIPVALLLPACGAEAPAPVIEPTLSETPTPSVSAAPMPTYTAPAVTPAPPVRQAPLPAPVAPVPAPAPRAPAAPPPAPAPKPEPPAGVYYKNCDAARAAGAAPISRGEPGYRAGLDRDDDGVACE
jgi:hypothetical protein